MVLPREEANTLVAFATLPRCLDEARRTVAAPLQAIRPPADHARWPRRRLKRSRPPALPGLPSVRREAGWVVRLGSRHSNRHAVREHSAMCVQSFDDSLNSAIHITYRISLRSSSLREPRYPLLRVVSDFRLARPSPH